MPALYNAFKLFAMVCSVIATIAVASFFFGGEWKTWEEIKSKHEKTVITEDDMKNVVKKNDIEGFASQGDLDDFAKNEAIADFVSKGDLDGLAKEEVRNFFAHAIGTRGQDPVEELRKLVEHVNRTQPELHIESGTASVDHTKFGEIRNTTTDVGFRGAENERINFASPFSKKPDVIVALTHVDHVLTQNNSKGETVPRINNLRISSIVTSADRDGFNYSIGTWADTDIWAASLSWIAYGYKNTD